MGTLRVVGSVVVAIALTSCGGGDAPLQLVDGSRPAELPPELAELDAAVMTQAETKRESDVDRADYEACRVPVDSGDRTVIERTGLHGSSLTIESGSVLYGCDRIVDPATADDPDRPYDGVWCGAANGRVDDNGLNDPRLDICSDSEGSLAAFVWVEPRPDTKWVVVFDSGSREVYEVAAGLPVRVTTTDTVDPAGSAAFDIEEYDGDGTRLRDYTLEAQVAG